LTEIQCEKRTTVDKKPASLLLHNARARARAGSASPAEAQINTENSGWVGTTPPAAVPAAAPTFTTTYPTHPTFPTPNLMGTYYPQFPQPATNSMPFHAPTAPLAAHTMPGNERSPQDYPDIVTWCQYLDSHNGRNQDGIVFAPFGASLKKKGFVRITQLTSDFVCLKDLQEWLDIEVGTAILIMQYAKADVQAIDGGRLFFPRRQDNST
jgi:hypothetical protein